MNDERFRSRKGLHLILAGAMLTAWACIGSEEGGDELGGGLDTPVARDALRSIADNAIAPTYADFAALAEALESATADWAAAVGTEGEAEAQANAAEAWRAAIAAWQRAELMQLGRAATSTAIAGENLRDEIYSWPTVNSCLVDAELIAEEFDAGDFVDAHLVNVYGLDSLEYLLFRTDAINDCPPQHPINSDGQWDAMGTDELASRRARYAAAIASSLSDTADALEADWAGTYADWLAAPDEADSPYGNVPTALDEVMRAMFYLDKQLKDAKLAEPGGITCTSNCLDKLESKWALASKDHARANLEGFRRIYLGGTDPESGTGFDDILVDIGEDALAAEMLSAIDDAIVVVDSFEGDFGEALAADEGALDEAHAAVKRITDLLKGEFATVLSLTIPSEAAGDAD